jgi:hypothetical protein
MTAYDAFALGRMVLCLALGAIFLALAAERLSARWLRRLALGAVVAGLLAYPNFGAFHPTQTARVIHYLDAFHYFMGAKYLPELGYTRLYEATLVAGRELGALRDVVRIRDLTTYELRETATIDAGAVRARFSPARWAQFKRDLAFFGHHIREWPGPLLDHGYNDPPPRAWLLHGLVRWVPASVTTLILLTSLDYVLLVAALAAAWRAFGMVPAALAFASLLLSFFARFDFIGGSLLRWDWAVALLLGACALARGAGTAAGLCLGYAALARLFPALFLVPLAVKWLQARLTGRRDARLGRCLASAAVFAAVVVASLVVAAESRSFLRTYAERIHLHSETLTSNSVGLGSLIVFNSTLWHVDAGGRAYLDRAELLVTRPAPWVLPVVTVVCFLVTVPLIRRSTAVASLMYGVPLVYCAFSPSGYYYSFLVLLVLLPWDRGRVHPISLVQMGLLAFLMAVMFAFDFGSNDMLPLFNAATIQLGIFLVVWLGFEHVRLGRLGARAAGVETAPPAERAAAG